MPWLVACVPRLVTSVTCNTRLITCVTWLIKGRCMERPLRTVHCMCAMTCCMCAMTHVCHDLLHVCRDSVRAGISNGLGAQYITSVCITWLVTCYMCAMTHYMCAMTPLPLAFFFFSFFFFLFFFSWDQCVAWRIICASWLITCLTWLVTYLTWLLTCVPWLMTRVTWLIKGRPSLTVHYIHMWNMTHYMVKHSLDAWHDLWHAWHDVFHVCHDSLHVCHHSPGAGVLIIFLNRAQWSLSQWYPLCVNATQLYCISHYSELLQFVAETGLPKEILNKKTKALRRL